MTASNTSFSSHPGTPQGLPAPVACFSVHAKSDPGSLPRVLEPFAKRGLVPAQVHVTRDRDDNGLLQIDLQMADMDLDTATTIGRSLNQIFGIQSVLVSEKVTG
ncbi:hypothetical protein [Aestuariispira insulae]|uniref:hypothetical protein n=1 Tax=Aestuariispira insulae TaxID=1461337 RepID=UPI001FE54B9C|nr:hypothetical protein [Aestuariispira insulae]